MKRAPRLGGLWMATLLLGASLLPLGGCGQAVERGETAVPPLPRSVVYGTVEDPAGGLLAIGHLVPEPPSQRLVDLMGREAHQAFLDEEAAREAGVEFEEEPIEEEVFEGVRGPDDRAVLHARLVETLEAALGLRVVVFDVLARDGVDLPLFLFGPEGLTEAERRTLVPWLARGGRLLAASPEHGDLDLEAVVSACREALETSPLVARLALDPLAVRSAKREGDRMVVSFAAEPAAVSLRDLEDVHVADVGRHGAGRVSVEAPEGEVDPYRHRLVATWRGEHGLVLHRAWRIADLVGATERVVVAPKRVEAGAAYAPHVLFTNDRTQEPVAGCRERLTLVRGGETLAAFEGTSNEAGGLDARLDVPADVDAGPAELVVGDDRFPVEVQRTLRLSVVTDRALYRPTDEVHVRVMLHDAARGRPVPKREVRLRLGDVEQRVETSEHGIASARFRLVDAKVGSTALRAEVGGASAKAAFRIAAFERPTFVVEAAPATLDLRGGERAPVQISGRYVNGTPIVGAAVTVEIEGDLSLDAKPSATDAQGRSEVVLRATGDGGGTATVRVQDADGRTETCRVVLAPARVEPLGPRLAASPLADLVVGLPGRVGLEGAPGETVTVAAGEIRREVRLDEEGHGEVVVTPSEEATVLVARGAGGQAVSVDLAAHVPDPSRPLAVPARRVARVGEDLEVVVVGGEGPVTVQVARDGTVLRSFALRLEAGRRRFAIPLEADLAGVLDVAALDLRDPGLRGTRARVLVVRDRALRVTARAAEEAWRPGETAGVDVWVHDRDGTPTSAVLGYWGVDEALLALEPSKDGREDVFDLGGVASGVLAAKAEREEGTTFVEARAVLGALGPEEEFQGAAWALEIQHRRSAARERESAAAALAAFEASVDAARTAVLEAYARVPLEALRTASSTQEVLGFVADRGLLPAGTLCDPWGTPFAWAPHEDAEGCWILVDTLPSEWSWPPRVSSAGPDLCFGTADDLRVTWEPITSWDLEGRLGRFVRAVDRVLRDQEERRGTALPPWTWLGPSLSSFNNALIGLGGGAGGAFRGRGGGRDLSVSGGSAPPPPPVRLREDFAPTLCFVPQAVVGPDGQTHLSLPLKDAITTWRLRLVAQAPDGATGIGESRIRVTQPLHAEPWIAPHLTVGDRLELPVALRNETEAPLDVHVALRIEGGLDVEGAAEARVVVGPGGTGAATFRLHAVRAGEARVRIDAGAGSHRDAIARVIRVHHHARAEVETLHATLGAGRSWRPQLAAAADPHPREHRLQLYASPMATLIGGLEGLLTCPHG